MRIATASIVAAIVLFMFGFVWWALLMETVAPAKVLADKPLVEQMAASLNESGLYIYPDYTSHSEDDMAPLMFVYFNAEAPSMPLMMGSGFLHMLASAFFASLVVSRMSIESYSGRLSAVLCLGVFVAVWADVGNAIWWRHPLPWTVFHIGYDVCSWLLAGLVIAAIVKPCPQQTSSEQLSTSDAK